MTAASPLVEKICPWCGVAFKGHAFPGRGPTMFCTPAHEHALRNLLTKRGRTTMVFAQVWRDSKNGSTALTRYAQRELCALLDQFNAEDRAAGRRPDLLVKRKMDAMWSAADLATRNRKPRGAGYAPAKPVLLPRKRDAAPGPRR